MRKPDPTGHVYIVELSNGLIKVGMSKYDPSSRIRDHKYFATQMGCDVTRTWASRLVKLRREDEIALIDFCHKAGGNAVKGKEWFSGVSYEQAHSFAMENIEEMPCDEKPYSLLNRELKPAKGAESLDHADPKINLIIEMLTWIEGVTEDVLSELPGLADSKLLAMSRMYTEDSEKFDFEFARLLNGKGE